MAKKSIRKTKTNSFAPIPISECVLARAISVIGDGWTLLILREAIHGVTRFDEIHSDLCIPRAVLSSRLKTLVDAEIFIKKPIKQAGLRSYNSYVLSPRGEALIPVLIALGEWGNAHLPGPKSRLSFHHKDCDAVVHSELICEHGHPITDLGQLEKQIAPRKPA